MTRSVQSALRRRIDGSMTTPAPHERSTISLRARIGAPLADEALRDLVVANARAIAERNGVRIASIDADDASITIVVEGPGVVALGLAAELRRTTDAWHRRRHGAPLWDPLAERDS
jgi:hypothetical protein